MSPSSFAVFFVTLLVGQLFCDIRADLAEGEEAGLSGPKTVEDAEVLQIEGSPR